ncbi:hypothetical protein F5Y05DRAFT_178387 [Hypoxylon sp. FL0543]|nr:hypothetical protein F5Y05DRAFT_178387 [Hypoxylon sp. FL0543]
MGIVSSSFFAECFFFLPSSVSRLIPNQDSMSSAFGKHGRSLGPWAYARAVSHRLGPPMLALVSLAQCNTAGRMASQCALLLCYATRTHIPSAQQQMLDTVHTEWVTQALTIDVVSCYLCQHYEPFFIQRGCCSKAEWRINPPACRSCSEKHVPRAVSLEHAMR